jgi:type IV secretory pathway TrbL component
MYLEGQLSWVTDILKLVVVGAGLSRIVTLLGTDFMKTWISMGRFQHRFHPC